MSAFMSFQDQHSICILTDGAAYDADGVVLRLGQKTMVARKAPFAVTTRGGHVIGQRFQKILCEMADERGVDNAIAAFASALPGLASDPAYNGLDRLHWHIAAHTKDGFVRYSAHNLPFAFADGEAPMVLHQLPARKAYVAATGANLATLRACGVTPVRPRENVERFLRRMGANLMEAQRRTPATPVKGEQFSEPQYLIGGQCDLTIVKTDLASVTTLRKWPDRIGEKINPFQDGRKDSRFDHQRTGSA